MNHTHTQTDIEKVSERCLPAMDSTSLVNISSVLVISEITIIKSY